MVYGREAVPGGGVRVLGPWQPVWAPEGPASRLSCGLPAWKRHALVYFLTSVNREQSRRPLTRWSTAGSGAACLSAEAWPRLRTGTGVPRCDPHFQAGFVASSFLAFSGVQQSAWHI